MLTSLRNAGKTWLGKIIAASLFVLLIVSFAIFGIGDIFRGNAQQTVATIGKTSITVEEFRNAYQNEIQRLTRQFRQPISPEQARALGFDKLVLNRMITESVLNEKAREMGLVIPDTLAKDAIMEDPNFQSGGRFNPDLFREALRSAGLSEQAVLRDQKAFMARRHLTEALTGEISVPLIMREAGYRYGAERRSISYMLLLPEKAGQIAPPTDDQLQAFFNDRKQLYRAAEVRGVNLLVLKADDLAKPNDVNEADIKARYEQTKAMRFGTPERRTIQQIAFPSQEEAKAAHDRIVKGATFEAIIQERGLKDSDVSLGNLIKADIFDKSVADAAFALPQGGVSSPVIGRFGPVLLKVTAIEAERIRPLKEVEAELRQEIAMERARSTLNELHDRIEDDRAAARSLSTIAGNKGLILQTIPLVDRSGRSDKGETLPIPEPELVVPAIFASDIGADNEALRTKAGGWIWFEVTNITPSRDRSLDEARDEVRKAWEQEQIASRLEEKATKIVEILAGNQAFEDVAKSQGLEIKQVRDLARNSTLPELPANVITQIFATPVQKAGSVAVPRGRIVFKVDTSITPPFVTTTQEAAALEERLKLELADDLITQYVAYLQTRFPVTINQAALRRATGGE